MLLSTVGLLLLASRALAQLTCNFTLAPDGRDVLGATTFATLAFALNATIAPASSSAARVHVTACLASGSFADSAVRSSENCVCL